MIKIVIVTKENSYMLNNVEYQKGTLSINHSIEGISIGGSYANYDEVQCDGNSFSSILELTDWLSQNLFRSGGGGTGEGVLSVTGNLVKGTSINPIISLMGTPSDIVTFDDSGNPEVKPIGIIQLTDVAGFPTFANGVFVGTAMNATNKTGLLLFIEFSTNTPKAGTFPTYGSGGTLPVAIGIADGDAVNKGQLDSMMKVGETTFTLNGTQTVFNIPHGLGSTPKSFSVSFSDAGNLNFVQSLRTRNGTNITFTCADPPLAGSQTVYWQVFK